jgi:hypothetical protein
MTITTNDDGIRIELHGREQFWALRAKISILKSTINNVSFMAQFQDWRRWEVRLPGTHAPKLLLAGSYWTEDGWDFLYIKKPVGYAKPRAENVLVIETTENRYRRIIISSDELESSGIIKWWNKTKQPVHL